jgi:hypothetical protein
MIAAEKYAILFQACPTIRMPQCRQAGASAWMAHSKHVECVRFAVHRDLKRLVIIVAASFAFHGITLLLAWYTWRGSSSGLAGQVAA